MENTLFGAYFSGYVRAKFGDQSGQYPSDSEEEESEDETEEESSEESEESSSEESESTDRSQPHEELYYPNREFDNQSRAASLPTITVKSPVCVSSSAF